MPIYRLKAWYTPYIARNMVFYALITWDILVCFSTTFKRCWCDAIPCFSTMVRRENYFLLIRLFHPNKIFRHSFFGCPKILIHLKWKVSQPYPCETLHQLFIYYVIRIFLLIDSFNLFSLCYCLTVDQNNLPCMINLNMRAQVYKE